MNQPDPARRCVECAAPTKGVGVRCRPCADKRRRITKRTQAAGGQVDAFVALAAPSWVERAAHLYHSGLSTREVAVSVGMSAASVEVYRKRLGWDKVRHKRAREARRYPWREHVRPLFEAGMDAARLAGLTGLGKRRLYEHARRWGWDFDARHRALHTRDDGLTPKEADRARRMIRKYAGRSRREDRPTRAAVARLLRSTPVCPYCGRATPEGERTIDHIEPLTSGGSVDVDNLAAVCLSCNSSKQGTPLLVWLARRAA